MSLNQYVTAGVDINGKDHNTGDWIVPGWGGGLVLDSDMSHRVCQIRDGVVTKGVKNPVSYSRPMTRRTFTVPFEVSGEIFLISRMADPFIIGENRNPTWNWSPNFHPVFVDENNNVVTGLSEAKNRWTSSGQIDKVYGIPSVHRFKANMNHDDQLGAWHRWRMCVPEVGVHEVWWDGELAYRVVEKDPPAAWWGRPMHAALRLDFYDYKLRFDPFKEYSPTTPIAEPKGTPVKFTYIDPSPANRIMDTRSHYRPEAEHNHNWKLDHPSIPTTAVAMEVNLVAVGATDPGWLTAWSTGAWPGTASINYGREAIANQVTVGIKDKTFRTRSSSQVHFIMDIVGYYEAEAA
jgi:hypothetical protein